MHLVVDSPCHTWYNPCMTFALAFADLDAAAPRQRARCAATGRFVAWSKVPQLRVPGAPRIVVIPSTLVAVVDGAEVAPVAPVAEVAPVVVADAAGAEAPPVVGGGFLSKARALGASLLRGVAGFARSVAAAAGRVARTATVAGALAIGDGAPRSGRVGAVDAPPSTIIDDVDGGLTGGDTWD